VFVVRRDLCQALLRNDFWLAMEKRHSLRRVTKQALIDYIDNFYNGIFIESLIQGNITAKVRLISGSWHASVDKPRSAYLCITE